MNNETKYIFLDKEKSVLNAICLYKKENNYIHIDTGDDSVDLNEKQVKELIDNLTYLTKKTL